LLSGFCPLNEKFLAARGLETKGRLPLGCQPYGSSAAVVKVAGVVGALFNIAVSIIATLLVAFLANLLFETVSSRFPSVSVDAVVLLKTFA